MRRLAATLKKRKIKERKLTKRCQRLHVRLNKCRLDEIHVKQRETNQPSFTDLVYRNFCDVLVGTNGGKSEISHAHRARFRSPIGVRNQKAMYN